MNILELKLKVKRPNVAALNKLNRVIQLCTTLKQLDGAIKYCNLYVNTLPDDSSLYSWDQFWENRNVIEMLDDALRAKRLELKNENI